MQIPIHINHLAGIVLFGGLVSLAFASLGQRTPAGRFRHAAWSFLLFMAFAIGLAWLLYPLSR
jgi:hypothetical protein